VGTSCRIPTFSDRLKIGLGARSEIGEVEAEALGGFFHSTYDPMQCLIPSHLKDEEEPMSKLRRQSSTLQYRMSSFILFRYPRREMSVQQYVEYQATIKSMTMTVFITTYVCH
jgi:hypothetical protein